MIVVIVAMAIVIAIGGVIIMAIAIVVIMTIVIFLVLVAVVAVFLDLLSVLLPASITSFFSPFLHPRLRAIPLHALPGAK